MKNKITLIFLLITSINFFGCSPANILAGGASTGMVVAEGDRSIGSVVDDATIKINIAAKFINSNDNLFVDVSSTVLDGRVLLTGLVDNQEIRIDAVRRVWEVNGVNEVVNEIQVGNRASLKEYAQEIDIEKSCESIAKLTKISKEEAKLLMTDKIQETNKNISYLFNVVSSISS